VVGGGHVGRVVHRGARRGGRGGPGGDVHGEGRPGGHVPEGAGQDARGDGAASRTRPPVDGPGGPGVGGQRVVDRHALGHPCPVVGHGDGEPDGVTRRDRGAVRHLGDVDGRPQDHDGVRRAVRPVVGGGHVGRVVHRGARRGGRGGPGGDVHGEGRPGGHVPEGAGQDARGDG